MGLYLNKETVMNLIYFYTLLHCINSHAALLKGFCVFAFSHSDIPCVFPDYDLHSTRQLWVYYKLLKEETCFGSVNIFMWCRNDERLHLKCYIIRFASHCRSMSYKSAINPNVQKHYISVFFFRSKPTQTHNLWDERNSVISSTKPVAAATCIMTLEFLSHLLPAPQASMMTFRNEAASADRNPSATHSSWLEGIIHSQQWRRAGEFVPELLLCAHTFASGDRMVRTSFFLLQPWYELGK